MKNDPAYAYQVFVSPNMSKGSSSPNQISCRVSLPILWETDEWGSVSINVIF